MNTVLYIAICWSSIALVRGLSVVKPMIEASKEEFYPAVVEVGSNGKTYPGMYVNGRAVATSTEAYGDNIQVCGFIRVPCTIVEQNMLIVNDVGYLSFPWYPNFTRITKGMTHDTIPTNPSECVAVSAIHEPVLVTIKGLEVECSDCQHMDTLLCDYQVVGVLLHGKNILFWRDMLDVVEELIGKDDQPDFLKHFEKKTDKISLRASGGNGTANGLSSLKHVALTITLFATLV